MIAGRGGAESGGDQQDTRQQFAEWLEGGQRLLARVAELHDALEQGRAAVEAANAELAQASHDTMSLRHDNSALRSENARLADEVHRLAGQAAGLDAEAKALRAQNAALLEERGETAKLIADKLEEMLAQVLPRLARRGAGSTAPGGSSEAEMLAALAASVKAPPPSVAPAPARLIRVPAAPAPEAPIPAAAAAAAPAPPEAAWLQGDAAPDGAAGPAPASRPEPVGATAPPDGPAAPADASRGRILIADDEADFATLLQDHLGANGYEVLTASSGEGVLSLLDSFQPRVVLLDMMMAGIGGMETLRRIKAARPETSVIMITALDDRDVARKALAAGATDYLTKPLSLDFLESALAVHAAGPLPAAAPPAAELATAAPASRRTHFARA